MEKKLPVAAAQMFTARDYMQNDEGFVKLVHMLKDIGYTVVQLSAHTKVSPACTERTLKETGIFACGSHTDFNRIMNDFDAVVAEHKSWNCPVVGTGSMPAQYRNRGEEGYKDFIKDSNEVSKKLEEAGLKFSYHNHAFEFTDLPKGAGMQMLIDECYQNTEFVPDVYWMSYAGYKPCEWLKKMEGRVSIVHYKDLIHNPDGSMIMCEVGKGILDFQAITDTVAELGFPYAAVEQDICQTDPVSCLATSYKALNEMGIH